MSNLITVRHSLGCAILASLSLTGCGGGGSSSTPIDTIPDNVTVNVDGNKIELKGKKVEAEIKAQLLGKEVTINNLNLDKHTANIDISNLNTVGEIPIVVSKDNQTLYEGTVNIPLPTPTGNVDTIQKTGVTTCGNATDNKIACSDKDKLGDYYQLNQDGELQSGVDMSYSKVAYQATDSAGKPKTEYCALDKVTGLIWELKTDDDGLQDKDNTFTWYDSNSATNGGVAGVETPDSGDSCNASLAKCNSEQYLKKLNENKYCGYSDWRLPSRQEIFVLRDFGKTKVPFINDIFVNMPLVEQQDTNTGEMYQSSRFLTSTSQAVTNQSMLDAGAQQYFSMEFAEHEATHNLGYKNGVPFHIIAVRGK